MLKFKATDDYQKWIAGKDEIEVTMNECLQMSTGKEIRQGLADQHEEVAEELIQCL